MIHIIEILFKTFGAGGNIVVGIVFFIMTILGMIIAMRGRRVMTWLVSACGMIIGILAGAMVGIMVFYSFVLMLVFAVIGGVLMLLLLKYLKGLGYFIGIGLLSFFLAFVMTSEMYITNTKITENTLLLIDLVIAVGMGILSVMKSKFFISFITATSGGMITSISVLGLFGYYFSDWKTWTIAILVAALGLYVQIKTYGLGLSRKTKAK